MKKRILAICLTIMMIAGLLPNSFLTVNAQTGAMPSINVNVGKKMDIALAVGHTSVNYSNLITDLKNEIMRQGNLSEEDVNISGLESNEVGTSDNFAWWTYDHSYNNQNITDETHKYIEQTAPNNEMNYGSGAHPYYEYASHILTTNGGADLDFKGYGSNGYKDFMYLEDSDLSTKTFEFDIVEDLAYDALDGVGFLFNTTVTGSYEAGTQAMSGYLLFLQYGYDGRGQEMALYKFTNVNTKNFHQGNPGLVNSTSFHKIASSSVYSATDKYRRIKIEAKSDSVKVWYEGSTSAITTDLSDDNIVEWVLDGETLTELSLDPMASSGFGPLASYRSHGCNLPTSIAFKNLKMKTESVKSLTEVVREPEWSSDSVKYIVNLNEAHIDDFDDQQITSEIINRLFNDNVYYVGLGSNENEEQTEEFIGLNDLMGDFYSVDSEGTDSYEEQVSTLAASILSYYATQLAGDTDYVLTTDNVQLTVTGGAANDTADENWPEGRWKVIYSSEGFDGVTEDYPQNNQYVSDLDVSFAIPGTYEIYYEDSLVRTIIAHRKPVASFQASIVTGSAIEFTGEDTNTSDTNTESEISTETEISTDSETNVDSELNTDSEINNETENTESSEVVTGAAITFIDNSVDPDDPNGIDASKNVWKYIDLSEESPEWQTSDTPIAVIKPDHKYLVTLIVTDKYGAVSNPYTKQISYTEEGINMVPYADFELSTSTLIKGVGDQIITISDKSYDLNNAEITRIFTLTKDGQEYDKDIVVGDNDFSEEGAGTYKISLVVVSEYGTSEKVTRSFKIIKDETDPTVSCNVADGTETGYNKVTLTFKDLGDSGLKEQQVLVDKSAQNPSEDATGWSSASSSLTRNVFFSNDGTYYIHYKAMDNAGNTITGTFGPFTYEGNIPYVTEVLSTGNNEADVSVNTTISFKVSEKVIKGDGYITIYNKRTDEKYLDIHSSNNKVKIDNETGIVTVELPKVLQYSTSYYVTIGADFIEDLNHKAIAQYGDKDNWSFTTAAGSLSNVSDNDIKIINCEATQEVGGEETTPVVIADTTATKTFNVFVKEGNFVLTPVFSAAARNISLTASGCNAVLSEDLKKINISGVNLSENPIIQVQIGDGNIYTFKLKELKLNVNTEVRVISNIITAAVSGNSNLLNAIDLSDDLEDINTSDIKVSLEFNEPQSDSEAAALNEFITSNFTRQTATLFDAELIKRVTANGTTSQNNITNTQVPIPILINIPLEYRSGYSYSILRYHSGQIDALPTTVVNNRTQLSFETDRFSTYAVVYTKNSSDSNSDGGSEITIPETDTPEVKPVEVPTSVSVTAGSTTQFQIKNLPDSAAVTYHVTTPTFASVSNTGVIFGKKTGTGMLYISIKDKGVRTSYRVKIHISKSTVKESKVGFIQYQSDIVSYKNINYRVTKESKDGTSGTVAVANNQLNSKLPGKIVIPMKVNLNGKVYTVTSIDESAFYGLKSVKSVSIPYTVTTISPTAFVSCVSLKTFTVNSNNPNYSAKKGMLLNKKGTKLISYPSASGKVVIDSKISTIGAYAFGVCHNLTEVVIPSTIKGIEGCAFADSKKLIKVTFKGTKVPSIPISSIFDNIGSKAVIYVPQTSLSAYEKAFKNAQQPKGVSFKGVK